MSLGSQFNLVFIKTSSFQFFLWIWRSESGVYNNKEKIINNNEERGNNAPGSNLATKKLKDLILYIKLLLKNVSHQSITTLKAKKKSNV